MANPLTLYIPIKQDKNSQDAAAQFAENLIPDAQESLNKSGIVHYARLALIPNNPKGTGILALCLITTFDGPMNPYLKFFWNNTDLQEVFKGLAAVALNPPNPPVTDLTSFEIFINSNNLNQPADLYNAYPQTVQNIWAKFPPQA
jgi:hypothetical protein